MRTCSKEWSCTCAARITGMSQRRRLLGSARFTALASYRNPPRSAAAASCRVTWPCQHAFQAMCYPAQCRTSVCTPCRRPQAHAGRSLLSCAELHGWPYTIHILPHTWCFSPILHGSPVACSTESELPMPDLAEGVRTQGQSLPSSFSLEQLILTSYISPQTLVA